MLRHLLFLILSVIILVNPADAEDTYLPMADSELSALRDLYNTTQGPQWISTGDWFGPADPCTWTGINCTYIQVGVNDSRGKILQPEVSMLGLTNRGLIGQIPASISNFPSLTLLDLSRNTLSGPIPASIGNLSRLTILRLYSNQLNGAIPASLGQLTLLSRLELTSNNLTESIPDSLGQLSRLTDLLLGRNQLSGNIPSSLGNLALLKHLILERNDLSGTVPELFGGMSKLLQLVLNSNQLTGNIPETTGSLTALQTLILYGNQFNGSIPASLGSLTKLNILNLSNNQLSGSLPDTLGNLASLTNLDIAGNQLTGEIPTTLGNLPLLKYISLAVNQLSGSIPDTLGNLTELSTVKLQNNQLTGDLPPALGNLAKLNNLAVNDNQLSGNIPNVLLTKMESAQRIFEFGNNPALGSALKDDFITTHPWLTNQLQNNASSIEKLGDLSCYPDSNAFETTFSGTNWLLDSCSSEENSCPEKNTGPDCMAGNPINLRTGMKQQGTTDYTAGGLSPLVLRRNYNSSDVRAKRRWSFGKNNNSLIVSGSYVKLTGDKKYNYLFSCSSTAPSDCGHSQVKTQSHIYRGYTLRKLVDGYLLTLPSGVTEQYDVTGQLTATSNARGRTLNYSYELNATTISDEFNQQIVLTYAEEVEDQLIQASTPAGLFVYGYNNGGFLNSVTRPDGTRIQYLYDEANYSTAGPALGLLTGKLDASGQRFASWYYDDQRRAYKSEHGSNVDVTTINFVSEQGDIGTDEQGNPIVLQRVRDNTNALGKRTRTTFRAPFGLRAEKIEHFDQAGTLTGSELFSYDSNGHLMASTSLAGVVTQYIRDNTGRETSRTENFATAQARTITTSYIGNTSKRQKVTTPEQETVFEYMNFGNSLLPISQAVTDLASGITRTARFSYTESGFLRQIDGPRTDVNDITHFEYNAKGLRNKETNALGHQSTVTAFNAYGKPTTVIDANNITTTLRYDPLGRMLSKQTAGLTTSFAYDDNGLLTSTTLADGNSLNYEYDSAQRLIAMQDNSGNRIDYTLDAVGNRLSNNIKDASGVLRFRQQQLFDEFSRITTLVDGNNNTQRKKYLPNGLLESNTDELNYSDDYAYNAVAQLSQISDAAAGTTAYSYDNAGNTTSITDAENKETTYSYNSFGEVIEQSSPDTGITQFNYDEAGNLRQKVELGVSRTTNYQYDALNRVLSNSATGAVYSYDDTTNGNYGVGRLTSVVENSGTQQLVYNAIGNTISDTRIIGGHSQTTLYHYNALNQWLGLTYPSGRRVDFSLNSQGQISGLSTTANSQTDTLASDISYLPFGPMSGFTYGNGLALDLSYDLDYRLTGQTTGNLEDKTFVFTPRNNIQSISDLLDSRSSQNFAYSPVQSLIDANGDYGVLNYSYDAIGNRLTRADNGATDHYSYVSNKHHLQAVNGAQAIDYSYNAIGQTLQKGAMSFTYNATGAMATATNDGNTTSYQYNYLNQRISKTSGTKTTYYIYNLTGQLLAEVDDNGASAVESIYLNNQLLAVVHNPLVTTYPPEDLALDDTDTTVTTVGNWSQSKSKKAYNGYHQTAAGGSNASLTWTPDLVGGTYQVYARWVANRKYSNQAAYVITHAGQTQTVQVDQTGNANQWNLLGSFDFSGQGNESITLNDSNGKVSADAVRLVRVADLPQLEQQLFYIHNNHLGTPTRLTDTSAKTVWQAYYTPFGLATINDDVDGNNIAVTFNPRLPGQYFDSETSLHYNWHRYYDPQTGRYMSSDPLGLDAGVNTYGYVGANPVNAIDPDGQSTLFFNGGRLLFVPIPGARIVGGTMIVIGSIMTIDKLLNPTNQHMASGELGDEENELLESPPLPYGFGGGKKNCGENKRNLKFLKERLARQMKNKAAGQVRDGLGNQNSAHKHKKRIQKLKAKIKEYEKAVEDCDDDDTCPE